MKSSSITDKKSLIDIIRRCQWCHVAMVDQENKPYVIPMNFGFRDDVIYIHGAHNGKKVDILRIHPQVCINFSLDHTLRYQNEEVACSWSMKYRSVLCYGNIIFIQDPTQKTEAFQIIMAQYASREFKFNPPSIREVNVMKVNVDLFEGRTYGF